jgi:hypothetical protein
MASYINRLYRRWGEIISGESTYTEMRGKLLLSLLWHIGPYWLHKSFLQASMLRSWSVIGTSGESGIRQNSVLRADGVTQVVEHLPNKHEALKELASQVTACCELGALSWAWVVNVGRRNLMEHQWSRSCQCSVHETQQNQTDLRAIT